MTRYFLAIVLGAMASASCATTARDTHMAFATTMAATPAARHRVSSAATGGARNRRLSARDIRPGGCVDQIADRAGRAQPHRRARLVFARRGRWRAPDHARRRPRGDPPPVSDQAACGWRVRGHGRPDAQRRHPRQAHDLDACRWPGRPSITRESAELRAAPRRGPSSSVSQSRDSATCRDPRERSSASARTEGWPRRPASLRISGASVGFRPAPSTCPAVPPP